MEKKVYESPLFEVTVYGMVNNIMITSIGGTDGSGLPSGPSSAPARKEPDMF